MLAHFNHHEPEDRLPWPWMATIVAALILAVTLLALLAPDAIAPTLNRARRTLVGACGRLP